MQLLKRRGRRQFHDPELEHYARIAAELDATATIGVLTAPLGAPDVGIDAFSNGNYHQSFKVDPALGSNVPVGTVVEVENYAGPGTGVVPTVPLVQPSSTTADIKLVGVVTQGFSNYSNNTNSIPPGGIAVVCFRGIAQVLCDATTTAGQALIQSAATAGAAKTIAQASLTASNLGQCLGVALQAVTISSGTALVWAMIRQF
jgi:hypothetical protein